MKEMKYSPKISRVNISALAEGNFVVNLGEVLEIDELTNSFEVVIARMEQKQVFTFKKDEILTIIKSVYAIIGSELNYSSLNAFRPPPSPYTVRSN